MGDGLVQFFVFEWLAFQLVARRKPALSINRPLMPMVLSFLIALGVSSIWHLSMVLFSWTFGFCLLVLWGRSLYRQRGKMFVVRGRLIFFGLLSPLFLVWMQLPSEQPTDALIGIASKGSALSSLNTESWVIQELQSRPDVSHRLSRRMNRMSQYLPETERDQELTQLELIGLLKLSPIFQAQEQDVQTACQRISPDLQNAAQLDHICP